MNDIYPLDIWQVIFQHCDSLSQLKLIIVCTDFYHSFFITDLYDIPYTNQYKLTNLILQQRKFSRLVQLNVRDNKNVNNISFLSNLKKLNARYLCGIDQKGIQGLDLIELYVDKNDRITDVSFMKNLKKLYAYDSCGIDQQGINGLNLIELVVNNNDRITDVSFMSNLKKLYARGSCGINKKGIHGLTLNLCDTGNNPNLIIHSLLLICIPIQIFINVN